MMSKRIENSKAINIVLNEVKTIGKTNTTILPAHVNTSIGKGIKQYEAGQTISLHEFTRKYLSI